MNVKKHKKYNWHEIEKDFLLSEFHEVKEFLRANSIGVLKNSTKQFSGTVIKATKGWKEKKQEFLKKIADKAKEKMMEDDKILELTQHLIVGKRDVLRSILQRVETNEKNLNMQELKIAWEILKIELGESTKISENINKNINYDGASIDIEL